MTKSIFYSLIFFTVGLFSFANTIPISKNDASISVNAFNYIEDHSGSLELQNILSDNLKFLKGTSGVLGHHENPFWFQINLTAEDNCNKILHLDYPLTDYIDVYHLHNSNIVASFNSGDLKPFSNRPINNNAFAFPVTLKQGGNTLYIKIKTSSTINFSPKLYNSLTFYKATSKDILIQGIFYGWLLVMILYNAFLYFTTKEINYMYMCLFTLANGFLFISASGYGLQYLWTNAITWNQNSFIFFSACVSICSVVFSASFLDLKQNHRTLYNYHWVVGITMFIVLIGSLFLFYSQLIKPTMLIILHNSFFFPISAVIVYKNGNRKAIYFLLAWSVYLIGSIVAISAGSSIELPQWLKSFNVLQIGAALEVLLFSLALGNRINLLKNEVLIKEVEKIQLSNKLIREHNIQLEKTVEERTKNLKTANDVKDKFFAIIAHDLRGSVTSFKGVGRIIKSYLVNDNFEKIVSLSEKMDRASEQLNTLLDNLLNWSFTQLNNVPYNPSVVDLGEICKKEIALKDELTNSKNISLETNDSKSVFAYVDSNGISLIIGNLISNAIKFTHPNGSIVLDIDQTDTNAIIKVKDNGIGMTDEQVNSLFQLKRHNNSIGTSGEKGSGLGLILCKEFLDLNKGSIFVESKADIGTTITLQLPLPNTTNDI